MTAHSIDQPGRSVGHRPMSLLLQALRQIELKAPENLDSQTHDADATASRSEPPTLNKFERSRATKANIRLNQGPPQTTTESLQQVSAASAPAACNSIALIRQYEASETATEFAVADPAKIALVPLPSIPSEAATRSRSWNEERRRRFASEVLRLLSPDSGAIIALAPVDGVDSWFVIRELCLGLAECGTHDVLAIGRMPSSESPKTKQMVRLSDILSGKGTWQAAVDSAGRDGFYAIERGDDGILGKVAGRSLFKLWQELNDRFSYVVVDAGPVDSAAITGLLASCDSTFAVVRLNNTQPNEAERLISRIQSMGGRPCGCLVVE